MNQVLNHIASHFSDIFRNGTRDNINKNPEIIGFIIGALDNGFTVKFNGYMPIAKKGKVEIILRFNRDDDGLNIIIFKGREKQYEAIYEINGFMWVNVTADKGRLVINENYRNTFICSFL